MHSFKTEIHNNLKIRGCGSVFYVLKRSQWVNLIESTDALTITQIRNTEADYRQSCTYDNQNLDLGKLLLENIIDGEIRCSLHHRIRSTDGGASYYNLLCNHVLGGEVLNIYKRLCNWMTLPLVPLIGRALAWEAIHFARRYTALLTFASTYATNGIQKLGHSCLTTWPLTVADAAQRTRRRRQSISFNALLGKMYTRSTMTIS